MSAELEFTGERFVPGIAGEIAYEHWHRYAFARRFVQGRNVLDVACGEGYGSALLAEVAAHVVGVDIAADAIGHARSAYAKLHNVRFAQGSAAQLPLADATVDVVVSFETIEHLPAGDQPRMLAEIARVLSHNGILLLSAPNPVEYSQARNYRNPFHRHEPSRAELDAALAPAFPLRRWYRQRRYFGSALWSEEGGTGLETWSGDAQGTALAGPPAAMYFVVLAMRGAPPFGDLPALSLFADRDDAELARIDHRAAEVMRLDALLKAGNAELDRQTGHIRHLEELVAYRERMVEERDAQIKAAGAAQAAVNAERDTVMRELDTVILERGAVTRERDAVTREHGKMVAALAEATRSVVAFKEEGERLERAITAQERIIAYRQSARWWLALPWLRIKLWWKRVRDA